MTYANTRNWKIRRADGRTVEFTGSKIVQVGKAGIYETEGGNLIFQYAPYGNSIGLIVKLLPADLLEAESIMAEHCTGDELDRVLKRLGAETIKIA